MIQQQSNALTFYAMYVASKVGATGLTVTADVYEATTGTPIVSAASATELGGGLYYYTLASGSVDADGAYIAVFKTADSSVDQQHIPAVFHVGATWVDRIDATVSSRSTVTTAEVNAEVDTALADYDAPTKAELDAGLAALNDPTAAAIRAEIDSNSTQLAAIVADTNELQADWVNGGRLDLILDAILEDTGTTIPASISGLNDLSAAEVNAEMVDVVGTDAVEGALTHRDILRLVLAFIAGTTTGGNTTSITFKSQDGNTNRIVMTVDTDGDRSVVAVNGS